MYVTVHIDIFNFLCRFHIEEKYLRGFELVLGLRMIARFQMCVTWLGCKLNRGGTIATRCPQPQLTFRVLIPYCAPLCQLLIEPSFASVQIYKALLQRLW